MPFRNSVVGGTTLVRPAIRSRNFVAGASGWSIDADGSAEFNDVVIRGGGVGDAVIIGPAGKPQVHIGSTATAGYIQFPTNRAIENNISTIIAAVGNSGAANEYATLQLQGPSVDGATDQLLVLINSQNNDGSSEANMSISHSVLGGLLILDPSVLSIEHARLQVTPDASASAACAVVANGAHTGVILQALKGATTYLQVANDGRTLLTGMSSASSALFVNTAAGHTGNMLRTQLNGADRFTADNDGILTTYATNAFSTYTPVVAGDGGATFTTLTGWHQRIGKMRFFTAYAVVNTAGAGAANVTITAPVSLDRTTRQVVSASFEGLTANNGSGHALAFTGGAGAVFDRLRGSTGTNITGAMLAAGAILTITGWIREA